MSHYYWGAQKVTINGKHRHKERRQIQQAESKSQISNQNIMHKQESAPNVVTLWFGEELDELASCIEDVQISMADAGTKKGVTSLNGRYDILGSYMHLCFNKYLVELYVDAVICERCGERHPELQRCTACKRFICKDCEDEYSGLCLDCTLKLARNSELREQFELLYKKMSQAKEMCMSGSKSAPSDEIIKKIEAVKSLAEKIIVSETKPSGEYITWQHSQKEILWHLNQAKWWLTHGRNNSGAWVELQKASSYIWRLEPEIWKKREQGEL